VLQKPYPGRQQGHAFPMSREQGHPQLHLEASDLATQGRLADVKTPGGSPQVLLFSHRDEVSDLVQTHAQQRSTAKPPVLIPNR
jgi:hypothetical protein